MMLRKWEDLPQEMRTEEVRPYYALLRKKQGSLLCKRLFDILASLVLLVLLSPVFLVLAIVAVVWRTNIIPKTLTCGEGWLMAGEIAHYARQGVRSFIILQPFGCLPNHVCGRGVTKKLKEGPDAEPETTRLAQRLLKMEERNLEQLKEFL